MCLIIHSPTGKPIPPAHIRYASNSNKDGIGIMWRVAGRVFGGKAFFDVESAIKKLDELYKLPLECIAVHLRFRTHGAVCRELAHPFFLGDHGAALMHNGVFDFKLPKDWKGSDTSWFAEEYLKTFPADWLELPKWVEEIDKATSGSRVLYYYPDRVHMSGNWVLDDEIYYSTSNYKAYSYVAAPKIPLDKLTFKEGTRVIRMPDNRHGVVSDYWDSDQSVSMRWDDDGDKWSARRTGHMENFKQDGSSYTSTPKGEVQYKIVLESPVSSTAIVPVPLSACTIPCTVVEHDPIDDRTDLDAPPELLDTKKFDDPLTVYLNPGDCGMSLPVAEQAAAQFNKEFKESFHECRVTLVHPTHDELWFKRAIGTIATNVAKEFQCGL